MSFPNAHGLRLALCQWDGDLTATYRVQVGNNSFGNGSMYGDVQVYVTAARAKLAQLIAAL